MTPKPKPHKQAAFAATVAGLKKAVVATNPDAYLQERPTWRFGMLEMAPPYGWHELSLADAVSIRERLGHFERMTWQEILFAQLGGNKHQPNHTMLVGDIKCPKAVARLQEIAPDVDTVMTLRVAALQRVWGIMSGPVCQLVFWDPEHLVYPVKKH